MLLRQSYVGETAYKWFLVGYFASFFVGSIAYEVCLGGPTSAVSSEPLMFLNTYNLWSFTCHVYGVSSAIFFIVLRMSRASSYGLLSELPLRLRSVSNEKGILQLFAQICPNNHDGKPVGSWALALRFTKMGLSKAESIETGSLTSQDVEESYLTCQTRPVFHRRMFSLSKYWTVAPTMRLSDASSRSGLESFSLFDHPISTHAALGLSVTGQSATFPWASPSK